MRDDIYGGLKNALERGISIEQAVQSFINAGYNANEVRKIADQIVPGAMSTLHPQSPSQKQTPTQTQPRTSTSRNPLPRKYLPHETPPQEKQQYKSLAQTQVKSQKLIGHEGSKLQITFLVIILLLLIGVLAIVIFFRERIIDFFVNLF